MSFTSVHAAYFVTRCSNADASVKWETGQMDNTLSFQIFGTDREVKMSINQVQLQLENEIVLKDEEIRNCGYFARTKVYAAEVIITPAVEYPNSLDFLGEGRKVATEVICRYHVNGRAACP
jgi:hypothetical protein